MKAEQLMRRDVVMFRERDPVEEALDVLVREHIHGAPVVDGAGELVGVVSQLDIYFGAMTRRSGIPADERDATARRGGQRVGDVMTSPAVSATEDAEVVELCRMMYKLRMHRIPIVDGRKVIGMVSSLDICNAIASGKLALARPSS